MIEIHESKQADIVEFTIDGNISGTEFDDLIARLAEAIEEHGKINVLKHVRASGTVPLSRLWDDIKFVSEHMKHIHRLAVVADKKWINVLSKPANFMFSTEIKFFDEAHIEDARRWLAEPPENRVTAE